MNEMAHTKRCTSVYHQSMCSICFCTLCVNCIPSHWGPECRYYFSLLGSGEEGIKVEAGCPFELVFPYLSLKLHSTLKNRPKFHHQNLATECQAPGGFGLPPLTKDCKSSRNWLFTKVELFFRLPHPHQNELKQIFNGQGLKAGAGNFFVSKDHIFLNFPKP